MAESATTIPVFTVSIDVDMSLILALRRERARGARRAVGQRLRRQGGRAGAARVPALQRVVRRRKVELLLARQRRLRRRDGRRAARAGRADADRKTLAEIAAETRALADAARRRALTPDDLRDGTFTVSNLGMFGVRSFTAIINPPQAAILAVGGARRAPVEDGDGGVAFRD